MWNAAISEAVLAGDRADSEIYIVEFDDATLAVPRWSLQGPALLAPPAGGTESLYRISDFVLPPLVFFGLYWILARIGLPRSVCLLAGSLYVLHHGDLWALTEPARRHGAFELARWYLLPTHFGSILNAGTYSFSRFPYPLLVRVVEVAFLAALIPAAARRSKPAILAAGALLALITTLRFFDWTVLYPAIGFSAAVLAIRRAFAPAAALSAVAAIGLILSLPTLLAGSSHAGDAAAMAHLLHSDYQRTRDLFPRAMMALYPFGPICLGTLIAACPFVGTRTPLRLAFCAVTAALVLCCSFQIVTGWTIGAGHWYMQHVLPIVTAAAPSAAAFALYRRLGLGRARPIVVAAALLSFAHGAAQYATYVLPEGPAFGERREALTHVPKGDVVLTWRPVESKLAGPHIRSFLTFATFSPVPTEELLERYLLAMRLLGRPPETVAALFGPSSHADVAGLISGYEFIRYPPLGRAEEIANHLPPEWKQRWMDFYTALPEDSAALVAHVRKTRRLDYVLSGESLPWPVAFKGPTLMLYRIP